jgi:Cd2+/Zn2+-exporting ATPase
VSPSSRESPAGSVTFHIAELHCADELAVIQRGLQSLDGIGPLAPNYLLHTLRVDFDPTRLAPPDIAERLRRIGFSVQSPPETGRGTQPEEVAPLRATTIAGGVLLAFGVAAVVLGGPTGLLAGLAVASTAASGWPVARAAWRAMGLRHLDMNALMSIAAAGALAIAPATGEWLEAPTAMFLFGVALWLESFSVGRARRAVRSLVELTPPVAHRIEHAGASQRGEASRAPAPVDVPLDELAVGDCVLVKPGERIPVDGEVVAGASAVNEAPLTGESMPVEKLSGHAVYAGSLNGEGLLHVRALKSPQDSTLAHVARLVEQAQASRAPRERFVDQFARRYTPTVIALAIVVALVPPLVTWLASGTAAAAVWAMWCHRGLVLLVIACPCALVISTPVSIVSALAGAARKGVLIKGGTHLERAGAVRCVAFDKTGTLTTGTPEVVDVTPLDGRTPERILAVAAALESRSEHPIARAIVRKAEGNGSAPLAPGTGFQALPGLGAGAMVDGRRCLVGSRRLFAERGLTSPDLDRRVAAVEAEGRSAVLVAEDDTPIGIIGVADRVREAGADALALLRRQGVERIAMLTGDSRVAAAALATRLGVDEVQAELLPEEKVAAVRELRERHGVVAMIGDGVNDAPALAAADLGIAMGAAGTDVALETADVALMADELLKIPYALRLSRATVRNIKINIAVALGLKAAFLALAVVGLATLWMAVMADTGASLLVIANALRLLHAD